MRAAVSSGGGSLATGASSRIVDTLLNCERRAALERGVVQNSLIQTRGCVGRLARGPAGRRVRRDLATGLVEQEFDWDLGGTVRLVPIDLVSHDDSRTVYSIVEGEPLSASVRFRATTGMARGDWSVRAEVASTMSADAEAFHVTSALDAYEGERRVLARAWSWRFPRDGV